MLKSAKRSSRGTSFGEMAAYSVDSDLMGSFELMLFRRKGKPHQHWADEVALCVEGHGEVLVASLERPKDFERREVFMGDTILIPANCPHYMIPADGTELKMVILYLA